MTRSNTSYLIGIFLIGIAALFLSGILTALLIPQMKALWEWFGYEVGDPNIWEVYIPFVTLMIMPVILAAFALVIRKPK